MKIGAHFGYGDRVTRYSKTLLLKVIHFSQLMTVKVKYKNCVNQKACSNGRKLMQRYIIGVTNHLNFNVVV